MNDKPNIIFVNAHAKGIRRQNQFRTPLHEVILNDLAIVTFQIAVITNVRDTVLSKAFTEFFQRANQCEVDDAAAGELARLRSALTTAGLSSGLTPVDGFVARRNVQLGQRVQAGSPLLSVIALNDVWVEANFKESQLTNLRIDQPVAALIKDLKQRGMLDDTLVTFTTEFGRTPYTQSAPDEVGGGRDHNNAGFTVWMAGAGCRHGVAYGSTDEIGYAATDNRVSWHDFHATVLHQFGIDHTGLTFYHNGIERRLTNVHGEVVGGVLG